MMFVVQYCAQMEAHPLTIDEARAGSGQACVVAVARRHAHLAKPKDIEEAAASYKDGMGMCMAMSWLMNNLRPRLHNLIPAAILLSVKRRIIIV